jgi:ribonuclease R
VRPADLRIRVDLRDVPLVTIDGEDARDFDDAVYCEPKVGRRTASADRRDCRRVALRSPAGLDADALERSTSVYFPRRVIPMLPEKLSNGLCSLNPHVDRCVLVCDMVITARGEIKAYQFYPAVIHSAARLTYTEVAAVLSNTKGRKPRAARISCRTCRTCTACTRRCSPRAKARRDRLRHDRDVHRLQRAGQDRADRAAQRNDAHRLIEECMLAANVCAADFLKRNKHAGLYRVHAGPTPEKLENLRAFLRGMGLTLGGGDKPHASDYAALMAQIRDRPDAQMLQPCCCARCSRPSTARTTSATSVSPTRRTRTSPARSAAIPTCSRTARSRRSCRARSTRRRRRKASS